MHKLYLDGGLLGITSDDTFLEVLEKLRGIFGSTAILMRMGKVVVEIDCAEFVLKDREFGTCDFRK